MILNSIFRYILLPSFTLLLGISFVSGQSMSTDFKKTIDGLLNFSVPAIGCTELRNQLFFSSEKLILLDAREDREFEVSHLKGAIHIGFNNFTIDAIQNISKKSKIIIYCSVGYRSEKIGEQLKNAGYLNVSNLYGGIFEWSNLGYPIVKGNSSHTTSVHAYDQSWGKWLKKANKVY